MKETDQTCTTWSLRCFFGIDLSWGVVVNPRRTDGRGGRPIQLDPGQSFAGACGRIGAELASTPVRCVRLRGSRASPGRWCDVGNQMARAPRTRPIRSRPAQHGLTRSKARTSHLGPNLEACQRWAASRHALAGANRDQWVFPSTFGPDSRTRPAARGGSGAFRGGRGGDLNILTSSMHWWRRRRLWRPVSCSRCLGPAGRGRPMEHCRFRFWSVKLIGRHRGTNRSGRDMGQNSRPKRAGGPALEY